MKFLGFVLIFLLSTSFFSCQSSINKVVKETKYSAYEFFGIEKRDLFKKKIKNTKEDQQQAGESFKNALEKLKAIYAFDGGNLEKQYRNLDSSYQNSEAKVTAVHASVIQLETVAHDLFAEWTKELQQIKTDDLRSRSRTSLTETQKKYSVFHASLKRSESKLNPVLEKLKDHVLFLKHNLNAQAIEGLKAESGKIQNDIEELIKEMNSSITQSDAFIQTL